MSVSPVPSQAIFDTQGGKVAIQAGVLNNHGKLNISLNGNSSHLLERVTYVAQATFNSYDKQHDPTCLYGTRTDVLEQVYKWADGKDEKCIFWLNGLAGTGKSTIARTIALKYSVELDEKRLGASFFFSKGDGDASHARYFVTTITIQLAQNVPGFNKHFDEALTESNDIASRSLNEQWHKLVLGPLAKLNKGDYRFPYILIVDALDPCDDDNNIQTIVHLLSEMRSLKTVWLRVFLASRPESPIRYEISKKSNAEHKDFVLHNVSPAVIDHDISIYLWKSLQCIAEEFDLNDGWPGEEVVTCLIQNAGGLFIWAATACRFIREGKDKFAIKRLDTILDGNSNTDKAPEKHLDEIYNTILRHSVSNYTDEEKEQLCSSLRYTLGSVAVLFSSLAAPSLVRLLHLQEKDIDQTLKDLHAIMDIPQDQSHPLRLHHPSFRNFLLSKERCTDSNYWVDEKKAHRELAENCIKRMSDVFERTICEIKYPGKLIRDVKSSQVDKNLSQDVQYACLYWIQHLQKSSTSTHR